MRKLTLDYNRAHTAAWLARIAYRNAKGIKEGCKRLGMSGKLVSKDGAEVVIAKKAGELWFAFRGTEPTVLNDVLADLDLFTHRAKSAGRVHGGFQDEVDEVWAECLKEIDKNAKLKKPKALFFTGHSLGGAMATVAASRCESEELYTFGSPRVGNRKFVNALTCPHYRFVNKMTLYVTFHLLCSGSSMTVSAYTLMLMVSSETCLLGNDSKTSFAVFGRVGNRVSFLIC